MEECNKMKKKILQVLMLFLVAIFGICVYFYYMLTIGDTLGLLENLKKIDGVAKVESYDTYDGLANFELVLSDGGRLSFYNVGNEDLEDSNPGGFIITKVGNCSIGTASDGNMCRINNGVYSLDLNATFINPEYIKNLPNMVAHYASVESAFKKLPTTYVWTYKTEQGETVTKKQVVDCVGQPERAAK